VDLLRLARTYRTYKSVKRFRQIINVFLKYGFGRFIDQIHLGRYIPFGKRIRSFGHWPVLRGVSVPEALRMAFGELGPPFIKLAQLLSSRPDLITVHFANEFKKLQDEVPPFPAADAKGIIEGELKSPIHEVFMEFKENPVAAASIAQVHYATLRDGSDVIVKVQRPGIREALDNDITILSAIARLLDRYIPDSRFFNPVGIVDEFSKTVRKELDFTVEARSCLRFRKNFERDPDIFIPKVYREYASEKVLTMERIRGVRIDDVPGITSLGIDPKRIAKVVVNAYFKMIFEDGFFHADPHPGNIFVMSDGRIGFLDFGIVGYVSREMIETMANTFLALIHKDFDRLIDQYGEFGIIPEDVDIERFKKEFRAELTDFLEPLYGLTLEELSFSKYLETTIQIAGKHKMKMPPDLLLVNKAMLILENLGRELDPNFDFIAVAEPYASKLVTRRFSPSKIYEKVEKNALEISELFTIFPRHLKHLLRKALRDDIGFKLTHQGFEKFTDDMERASNRLALGIIISAILVSSAILQGTNAGPQVLGLSVLGILASGLALVFGIWLIISIIRSGML
jgi:ubiquinone biosynthesis protein